MRILNNISVVLFDAVRYFCRTALHQPLTYGCQLLVHLLISFAVYEWKTGKWSKCRLHKRKFQRYCSHTTRSSSSSAATTDNSLLAEHEKLNPNPLLIGYKVRKVYCTSTLISKAQQHVGKSQDGDIDKTFYISKEDKGGKQTTVSSKRRKFGKKRHYNMSDPFLTSSSVASNKFCDKQIRPHSRTVCTTRCSYNGNTSRYRQSSRDDENTISQTRNSVVEINARIMNLCQTFEWSEWSKCNLLSKREDSNYINYTPNDLSPDTNTHKCDKKVAGVQYRKRRSTKINRKTKQSHFLKQKCLSEYEERTCIVFRCNRKKKGGRYNDYTITNWNFTKDHKRRSVGNRNAVWSRPQLLLTNSFGKKKNRGRKPFQRKHKKVSHTLPLQLPTPQSKHPIPIPILPEPQRLTSTFIPFLHVGPWSGCKNENNNNKRINQYENRRSFNVTSAKVISNENQIFRNIMSKKHKRRKKGENVQHRGKREDDLFIGLKKLKSRNSWAPVLPSDIEISFVATSVPDPQTGIQRRTVECRGQDGERLPFR